jgi:hypothetical protein
MMKNIILFLKYYLYGFLIAALIGVLFIIYSLVFDNIYSYIDFNLYMQVNCIMAVPCGLHLWIVNLLDNIQTIKNKYHKLIFKGFASYWLGIVFSLALLASLELLNCFVTLPYLEYLTDNNLFLLSLLIAMPLGYVSKILIKNY